MTLSTHAALAKDKRNATAKLSGLQHRHYAVIAGIITMIRPDDEKQRVAQHFADELRATNANFDLPRFLRACGVEE